MSRVHAKIYGRCLCAAMTLRPAKTSVIANVLPSYDAGPDETLLLAQNAVIVSRPGIAVVDPGADVDIAVDSCVTACRNVLKSK